MNDDRRGAGETTSGTDGTGRRGRIPERMRKADAVFRALADPHECYLLSLLRGGSEWSLSEVVAKVAARENGVPGPIVGEEGSIGEVYDDVDR